MRAVLKKTLGAALAPLVLAGLLAGCDGDDQVRVYEVEDPTEQAEPTATAPQPTQPTQPTAPTAPSPAPTATASADGLPAAPPSSWRKLADPGRMRVATFIAGQGEQAIEIAVSRFPGDVGGLLANVNRWRRQLGLGPVTQEQLGEQVDAFTNGNFHGHLMRIEGDGQHMLAAAIHEGPADQTWFVKVVGAPAVIDQHVDDVFGFARSFGAGQAEDGS